MNVDPSFTTHWKPDALSKELKNDARAHLYILNLWAFCHQQKRDLVPNDPIIVAGICRFKGNAETFLALLLKLRIVDQILSNSEGENGLLKVHDFAEWNAGLVACWINGKKTKKRTLLHEADGKQSGSNRQANGKRTVSDEEANGKQSTSEDEATDKQFPDSVDNLIESYLREREGGRPPNYWMEIQLFYRDLLNTKKFPSLTYEGVVLAAKSVARDVVMNHWRDVVTEAESLPDHVVGAPVPWLRKRLSAIEFKAKSDAKSESASAPVRKEKSKPVAVPQEWA